jgi:hypothetical protein
VSSYGNEYLTSAFQSLLSMKSSSIAISKTWRAPSRSPSSVVIELRPAQVHAAQRQLAHGSMETSLGMVSVMESSTLPAEARTVIEQVGW